MDDYCDQCGYRGQSLRAENARLQERVKEAERNWDTATVAERITHGEWDKTLDELEKAKALERRVRPFLKRLIEATKPYHESEDASGAAEVLFDIYEDAVSFRALAQVEKAEPEGVLE